jgi:Domain of unknown function (DUF4333)
VVGRRIKVAAVAVAATLVFGACGGAESRVDVDALEQLIESKGADQLEGADVGEAVCPDEPDVDVGESFTCTLTVDAQQLNFSVTREASEYVFEVAEGVVAQSVVEVEDAVATFVLQNESVDVAAECGDGAQRWLFVSAPTKVTCSADYGSFARGLEVTLRRNGEVRNIRWTEAKLDLGVVNDRVGQQLIGQLGGFFLSCPETLVDESATTALPPGAKFECTAIRVGELTEIATVEVEVRDVDGTLKARVV